MVDRIEYHDLGPDTADFLLGAEVFDNPVCEVHLRAFVDDPGHMMVLAVVRGTLVGFASGTILLHPDKAPILFVNEVGVEEAWRQRGIGRALTERLLERANDRGCGAAWLATEADNAAARALYRRLAGRETGDIVVYDWGDAMS